MCAYLHTLCPVWGRNCSLTMSHADGGGKKAGTCRGWPWSAGSLMNGSAVWGWDVQTDITVLVCICYTCDRGRCGHHMPVVHMGVWGHIFLFLWVFSAAFGPHTSQCLCVSAPAACVEFGHVHPIKGNRPFPPTNMQTYEQIKSPCCCCNEHNQDANVHICKYELYYHCSSFILVVCILYRSIKCWIGNPYKT